MNLQYLPERNREWQKLLVPCKLVQSMRMLQFQRHTCIPVRKRTVILLFLAGIIAIAYYFSLPGELFIDASYSTVVRDRNGKLLGARISDDGQWRFPPCDTVPGKFAAALTGFEDRYFRYHPGVNPVSIARAVLQNIRNRRIVSGGSTLTMQVIRLYRNGKRNIWNKLVECLLATRLELRYTKDEILALYASHAPFGGNVVGIEAASWRYFGRSAVDLSWAEAATLAVLPNSPSIIHPGKNRELLKAKRDRLLHRLMESGEIDSTVCSLAISEPIPDKPLPLPEYTYHLTEHINAGKEHGHETFTGIDREIQSRTSMILERWNKTLKDKGINDLAAIIIDTHSGKILAYCGNARPHEDRNGAKVDILRSPRSTGSILKPLLYCALLQEGGILPKTLLPDIPVNINGFSPQNFDLRFYGAVPADEALSRSLNVPAVHMLREYGVPKFHDLLVRSGMSTLTRESSHYGLSIILGGAEGRLLEVTAMYAMLAKIAEDGEIKDEGDCFRTDFPLKDKVSIYYTLESLKDVNRPDEMEWRMVSSIRKVAWKTGTSFGFRDGWAVGVTPGYAVGVWAGNAQGQGVPGLIGAKTAGPVMFDIFNLLPQTEWFQEPYKDYMEAEVCRQSGHLKGMFCTDIDTLMLPVNAVRTGTCPYHRQVNLDPEGNYRVPYGTAGSIRENMFILPPAMEWYYRQHHPEYRPLPPYRKGSATNDAYIPMEFIYPESGSVIYVPRQLDGNRKGVIFNLAHSIPESTVYWHIDNIYIGSTRYIHQMTVVPPEGRHTLTAVDSDGNSLSVAIECRYSK